MKSQQWPTTYQVEETSIPAPSRNTSDIIVELRLCTKEAQTIFEEAIETHPHFCLEHKISSQSAIAELIILEAGYDHHPTFSFIKSITQHDGAPDIFLTSEVEDRTLAVQALRVGVKEFFPRPLQIKEITEALDRCATRRGRVPKKRRKQPRMVMSFFGGRGGIGTTTTAVNFGASLRKADEAPSVVLLELNSHAGDLALFLNITMPHTLRELGDSVRRLDQDTLSQFLVQHDSGLYVLSSGYTDIQAKPFASEWIGPIITLLKARFDIVLIDCGNTLDTNTTTAFGLSATIFVLSTLTIPVVKRTEAVLEYFKRAGIPSSKIQWVLNRYIEKENSLLKETENIFHHKTSWIIPNDFPLASQAMNAGCPLVVTSPNSAIAKSFRHMTLPFLVNPDEADVKSSKSKDGWVNRIWSKVMKEDPATELATP